MLESFHNNNFSYNKEASSQCGKIFCHSPTDFKIHCELCEHKCKEYEIFLLHFQLMHSDNKMLQTKEVDDEIMSYVVTSVEVETVGQNSDNFCPMETSSSAKFDEKSGCPSNVESNQFSNLRNINKEDYPELLPNIKLKKQQKCEYCGKTYRTTAYLENHIILEHAFHDGESKLTLLKCTECSEKFSNQHKLNNHSIKEHKGIQCSYCHRKFKCKANLIRHTEEIHTHSNNANFVCDFENCSKRFYTKHHLSAHKRISHGQPKNYICDVCGYNCRARSTLRKHSQIHTDEKPYSCDLCSAKFKFKYHLESHSDIHNRSDERNFLCDFGNCTKTFFSGRRLAVHIRNHKKPKKFVCDVCGYSSKHNQSLKIHYRKHTGEMINETS